MPIIDQFWKLLWSFGGYPQPGGGTHPPISRGGVLGEVLSYQADLASGQERKNTRILEWFGPPERNTLHPLCGVLLLV